MRNFAKIKVKIADDPDWRALSRNAQHLYFTLLISATINNAGVADWRPVRLSALASGWTAAEIEEDGRELEAARFIVVDEATEEVLLRSFVRHDDILIGPKTAQGMANAYRQIVSLKIRAAVCREVARVRAETPESTAWTVAAAVDIANMGAGSGPETGYPASTPPVSEEVPDTPSEEVSAGHVGGIPEASPTNSHTTRQPNSPRGGRAKRTPRTTGNRITPDWQPTRDLIEWVKSECPNVDGRTETENFRDYFLAESTLKAVKRDWAAAYRHWMRRAQSDATRAGRARPISATKPNAATERRNDSDAVIARLEAMEANGHHPMLALGAAQ
jgi:hypothetical protein